ncbi:MAG TPA: hypothetical protein VD816_06420 [Ohtaekwangia sp.]|nr:hypothetical protein [Ohtaekwangia sp.]
MEEIGPASEVTIVIYPFEDLTTDTAPKTVFCRSFYIDLVTELSRFRQFRVLAGEPHAAGHKSDYSIKGSFRYQNDTLSITAQLFNNQTLRVTWADRFEGDFKAIFSIQDDLLRQVVAALQQQLNYDLLTQIRKKPAVNLRAYEHWLYGMEALKKGSLEADEQARVHFQDAIAIDPSYALGYSGMSLTYFNEWSCQLWERWDVCQKGAFEWAEKAMALDEQNYIAAMILGRIYLYEAKYDIAEHYLRLALQLNPNDTDTLAQIASCFVFLGYLDEAEALYAKAIQLGPLQTRRYGQTGALIAFEKGQYEKCIALGRHFESSWIDFPAVIAAAFYHTGDLVSMKQFWQKFLEDFQQKISRQDHVDEMQAMQWIINVNPYKIQSRLLPFLEYLGGRKNMLMPRVFFRATPAEQGNYFRKENDLWQLSFEGVTVHMADMKGLHDLVKLLEQPEKQFHCLELMGSKLGMRAEPVFDERAKRSYQKKIQELQEEIRWSESNNDLQRTTILHEEYDSIVEHLSASLNLRGRPRRSNDVADKARSAVTWRLRTTIRKIEHIHPYLGRHLSSAVKTGTFCAYSPEKDTRWIVTA